MSQNIRTTRLDSIQKLGHTFAEFVVEKTMRIFDNVTNQTHEVKRDYEKDFFQSTRTDQNSSTKFHKILRDRIWLRELNCNSCCFFSVTYKTGRDLRIPFFFSYFATEWMLIKPKGPAFTVFGYCGKEH